MTYSGKVIQEDDAADAATTANLIDPSKLPVNWPEKGNIVGKNVKMRYRDGPLVLKGIDFNIDGCEKIGVAGRTG
jgi:ABC-type multidrug transport system fused ATPase/permease subunit